MALEIGRRDLTNRVWLAKFGYAEQGEKPGYASPHEKELAQMRVRNWGLIRNRARIARLIILEAVKDGMLQLYLIGRLLSCDSRPSAQLLPVGAHVVRLIGHLNPNVAARLTGA